MGSQGGGGSATGTGVGTGSGQGSGINWGQIIGGVLGGAGNYLGASSANQRPTTDVTQSSGGSTNPYGPASPLLDLGMYGALQRYLNPTPPPGGHTSRATNHELGVVQGLSNSSPILDPVNGYYGSIFTDPMGSNAIRSQFDSQANSGPITNMIGQSSSITDMIMQALGGGGPLGSGTSSYSSGGASGAQMAADPYLQDVLNGKWLDQNNPYMNKVVQGITDQAAQGYKEGDVPQIDSQYARAGRYGSNAYATAQAQANQRYNQGLDSQIAQLQGSQYSAERQNMMQGVGLQETRDSTQAQIDAQANASAASAGASRYGADLQYRLGLLGDAQGFLGQGLSSELGRLGLLNNSAGQLDQYRQGAMALAPALDQARYFGPLTMLQQYQRRDQAANAGALRNWQYQQNLPNQLLNTIMPIAGAFNSTTGNSTGQTTGPGANNNPMLAAILGAYGGSQVGGSKGGH